MPYARLHWNRIVPGQEPFHLSRRQIPADPKRRPHSHVDFSEIFWVEEGEGLHWVGGSWTPLQRSDLVLVKPGQVHCLRGRGAAGFTMLSVAFPSSILSYIGRRYFRDQPDFYGNPKGGPLQKTLAGAAQRAFRERVAALERAKRSRFEIECFLMDFFRLLASPNEEGPAVGPDWLRQACRLIAEQRHFSRGTAGFVELAGRSPEHVARAARRHLSLSPTELVNKARMDFAAHRLESGDESILELSALCGFENLGHFYKLFHQRFHMTPRQYRLRGSAFNH